MLLRFQRRILSLDSMAKRSRKKVDLEQFQTLEALIDAVNVDEKTWLFFQNYTNPDSKTFDNIVKSYISAGYSNNNTTKYRAVRHFNLPLFQRILTLHRKKQAEMQDNRELTALEYTRNELKDVISAAKSKQDISNWRGAVMDLAKLDGLLAERLIVGRDDSLQMDASMRQMALDLANRALLPGCQDAAEEAIDVVIPQTEPDTIEAQFEVDPEPEEPAEEPILPDDWFLSDGDTDDPGTQDMV